MLFSLASIIFTQFYSQDGQIIAYRYYIHYPNQDQNIIPLMRHYDLTSVEIALLKTILIFDIENLNALIDPQSVLWMRNKAIDALHRYCYLNYPSNQRAGRFTQLYGDLLSLVKFYTVSAFRSYF